MTFRNARVWKFETKRFTVELVVERDRSYQYDGHDPDGETQAKLKSGEYVAFNSYVRVLLDDTEIGYNALFGSVYAADNYSEFWTAHRDPDPMNRNCTIMRLARGGSVDAKYSICHYFPDMVSEAVAMAREYLRTMKPVPYVRAA